LRELPCDRLTDSTRGAGDQHRSVQIRHRRAV
jgi:hypothetical protein